MNSNQASRQIQQTPLMQASKRGDAAAVRSALGHSDANARDNQGWTALMHAAWHRRVDCAQALLTQADANLVAGANAWSALMLAVVGEDADCVRVIAEKSDCSTKNADGKTALEMGADLGAWDCVAEIVAVLPIEEQAVALKRWGGKNLPRLHAQMEARSLATAAGLNQSRSVGASRASEPGSGSAATPRAPRSL